MADDSYSSDAPVSSEIEAESGDTDAKIIERAKSRFKLAQEAERDNRTAGDEDARFRAGEQWPAEIKAQRALERRPCLTINKMPQFEQQVTNDQRQNRPSIKVHPVDDVADPETAKVFQGILKHIEVASSADTARDTAFENAVRRSYGYYRIVTEFASHDSFDQEIRVKRIRDPNTVLLDPNHQEPDGSDAEYGFVFERMPKDQYLAEYGESKLAEHGAWDLEHSQAPDWVDKDTVLIAEYFYKHYETVQLALLSDGQVMEKGEAEQFIASQSVHAVGPDGLPTGEPAAQVVIVKERTARVPSIKWCKLTSAEILEKTDWPGQWIPILPVYGAELVVDGKVIRESLTRHAKDPAQMYNFWKSAETEAITLAPKAPYIADARTIEGFEHIWATANQKNHSYLPFNSRPDAPPPQRQSFEPAIQAITQASMLASDEVKAVIGIYDGSLGARSNETSGIAIQRRNQQAQTSNFHFTDNLNRTIRHEGRIIVDLIPHIYDSARTARIIGVDGEQKVVRLNQEYQDESGQVVKHDMGAGKYDVTIDTGPSYQTRRQESASFMQEMIKAYPPTMQVAGDLVMKSMDVPGASDLAERFKKTLPPNLIDDAKNKQIPPHIQAQMQQQAQMIEHLTKQLQAATDPMEMKRIELESKERMHAAEWETKATIELAKLESKEALNMLAHQIAELDARTQMLGSMQPFPNPEDPTAAPEMGAPEESPMPMDAGGFPADGAMGGEPLTGEESPGLPVDPERPM